MIESNNEAAALPTRADNQVANLLKDLSWIRAETNLVESPTGSRLVSESPVGEALLGFLYELDCQLEPEGTVAWARRVVAGEQVVAAFAVINSSDADGLREARRQLHRAGRAEPGAALHLITGSKVKLAASDLEQFSDIDIKVASEFKYLHSAVRADKVCNLIITEAEKYIPEVDYVEQRLSSANTSAGDFLDDWFSSKGAGLLVVLGHAGHGKTCLAYHLARRLARRHLQDQSKPVPFLLTLHRHRHIQHFDELVLTHLQDRGVHGFTSAAFAFLINVGCVLPILDGFDELAETGGLRVARETLRGLFSRVEPTAKVLLTSRQAYFRHHGDLSLFGQNDMLSNLQTTDLEPFDEQQRKTFLQRMGLDKTSIQDIEKHVNELGAPELLASPLMLKILGTEAKAGGQLQGSSATEVLDLSITRMCDREQPKGKHPWDAQQQLEFLTSVADLMHESNSFELKHCDDWLQDIVFLDVPKGITLAKKEHETNARVVQLKNHPLLVCTVIEDSDALYFPHPLYRDFFLARQLKRQVHDDQHVRHALRNGLSDSMCRFLADLLSTEELSRLFLKCHEWIESSRDLWECLLHKCDKASKSDARIRTAEMHRCLGERRTFNYDNLSTLRFCLLSFTDFSFVGADLTRTTFQSCEFANCNPTAARTGGCRLYDCSSDPSTAEKFALLGIQIGTVDRGFLGLGRPAVPVQNDDPVVRLIAKFFQRFIRGEPGHHQKTAKTDSMLKGLGGEERKFTEREILPEMKRREVISEATAGSSTSIYVFNGDWQSDGDSLLADGSLSERLRTIVEAIRTKADRYNII